ncbi:MAG: hypothetical protein ACRC6T_00605 [Sarcina sp.]
MKDFLDFFDNDSKVNRSFNTTGICIEEKHYMVNINVDSIQACLECLVGVI